MSSWVSGEPRALPFGTVGRVGAGGLPPRGASGMGAVGHDGRQFESARANSVRLTVNFQTSKSPKRGESVKTLSIQSVEIHEYYKIS